MNDTFAYVAQGSGIDLDRARELFSSVSTGEYASTTVFVEQPSVDPMALRLQQVLTNTTRQATQDQPAAPLPQE